MNSEQSKRIYYLDVARGLAILFMIAQHSMIIHEKTAGEGDTVLGNIFMISGTAPAAPVFMLIMGIFFMKSKNNIRQSIIRGVKLLFLGYVLNLLRFTIPLLIAGTEDVIYLKNESPLELLVSVDILQLAGLSIILGSFLRKYAENTYVFPVIIISVLIISPYLWGAFDQIPLMQPLWGNRKNVYFPLFPWIVYPLLGMYLSRVLLDHDRFGKNLKKTFFSGSCLVLFGILVYDVFPVGDYHRSGAGIHLLMAGIVLSWLACCYWFVKTLGHDNQILKLLFTWSENVTAIYCIQWILFGWSMLVFGANSKSAGTSALIGLTILLTTHTLIKFTKTRHLFSQI